MYETYLSSCPMIWHMYVSEHLANTALRCNDSSRSKIPRHHLPAIGRPRLEIEVNMSCFILFIGTLCLIAYDF